ncbi:MAG: aromatic acid exporter family protein [Polyangiales bacterium]
MSQLTDPRFLTAKAAAATALAAALAHAAGVSDLLSASFVALVCITPTAYAGLRRALEQLGGAALGGGATALLLAALPWQGAPARQCLAAGVSVGMSTWACARLRWEAGHITAGFTVLYLVLLPFPSFTEGLRSRGLAVLLGALAATAVNAGVSWVFAGRILARRERLARAAVAEALRRTAAMCRDGARHDDLAAVYAPAFAVAAELQADLAALAREVVLSPRSAVRAEARARLATAARLEEIAHLGKHLAMLRADRDACPPGLPDALARAADALAEGRDLTAAAEALRRVEDGGFRAASERLARALQAAA